MATDNLTAVLYGIEDIRLVKNLIFFLLRNSISISRSIEIDK